jgi:hypothetical protein
MNVKINHTDRRQNATICICMSVLLLSVTYTTLRIFSSSDVIEGLVLVSLILFWLGSVTYAIIAGKIRRIFYLLVCGSFFILVERYELPLKFWVNLPFYTDQVNHTPADTSGRKQVDWNWDGGYGYDVTLIYDSESQEHFNSKIDKFSRIEGNYVIEYTHMSGNFYLATTKPRPL